MIRSGGVRHGLTLTDVVIGFAVVAMLVVVVAPSLACRSRESAYRVKCASNLRQIGQAMLLYANENGQQWPRTIHDPASPVTTQFTGTDASNPFLGGVAPNDVTAALYLLLRTQDIGTEVFVCPTGTAKRMAMDRAATSYGNFPDIGHLSFSLANPYPTAAVAKAGYAWTAHVNPEFAVAADMNPGTPELQLVTTTSPLSTVRLANSFNHGGDGQNVLFGDGHAEFVTNPFVGVNKDNVYTSATAQVTATSAALETIGGTPQHADDSVLLPMLPPGTPRPGTMAAIVPLPMWTILLLGAALFAAAAIAVVFVMKRRAALRPPPLPYER